MVAVISVYSYGSHDAMLPRCMMAELQHVMAAVHYGHSMSWLCCSCSTAQVRIQNAAVHYCTVTVHHSTCIT